MANVNIPRDIKDEFYRYKMPAIVSKVEGRGNGIKTYIVNMADIAKSLARPASYPTKFFGFELGAITTIEPEKDRYGVNGKHDASKLASVLDDFIEKFVLCRQCGRNPETVMVIDKAGGIELNCKACGGRSPVDLRHKLCGFIVKNPPPKEKRLKKPKKVAEQDEDKEDPKIEGEDTATAKPSARKKKAKDEEDEDDGVEWFTDTSKAATEQRKKAMLAETSELAAKLLSSGISENGTQQDPVERLIQFIKEKQGKTDLIMAEIQKVKTDANLDDQSTARVVTLALYHENFLKRIEADNGEILKKVVTNEKAQQGVLSAVVDLCTGRDNPLLKITSHILKALYDHDILEEDPILAWSEEKSKSARRVQEAAKPFTDWLQAAEEEGEDDGEEEDEEEEEEDEDEEEEDEDEENEDEEEED